MERRELPDTSLNNETWRAQHLVGTGPREILLRLSFHPTQDGPGAEREEIGKSVREAAAFRVERPRNWKSQPPEAGLQSAPLSLKPGLHP